MTIIAPSRRGFLKGIAGLIAAPAIVRIDSIMPVFALRPAPLTMLGWIEQNGRFIDQSHRDLIDAFMRHNPLFDALRLLPVHGESHG